MRPSAAITPAAANSDSASMIPDPQIPVTPGLRLQLTESRLVRPAIDPYHANPGFEGVGIDAYPLYRSRRRPLSR